MIVIRDNAIIRLYSFPVTIAQFSRAGTLPGSIAALNTFGLFVQSAEGSTFGIVPCISPNVTGTVAGIICAGGNVGAVNSSILIRQIAHIEMHSFGWAWTTSIVSLLSSFIWIKGYDVLFYSNNESNLPPQRRRLLLPKEQVQRLS